jgi:hypothetical protein
LTRLATASMNAQTHLRRVFGSMAPADGPKAGASGGPHFFDDVYGSSKKLPEVPRLRRRHADRARRPVLYLLGQCLKVGCDMAKGMMLLFVI